MNLNNYNFAATGWALDQLPALGTASEKLVLINLAGRHNDDENCAWPGIDRIAADVGIEPRSVKRALKSLGASGILRIQTRDKLKLPSLYFLNFDFHFEGVDDKKSLKAEKMPVRVTKSRYEGDKKSPKLVTKSHPNKQEDNKLLKTQQQPVVVGEIIWEKPLEANQKIACEILLADAALPSEICQKFADEMAADGRRAPIRNPAGWLKNMLCRYGRAGFTFAYADLVAAGRAGRAAQAARESLALALPPQPKSEPLHRPAHPAPEVKTLSAVGRAALAAMGRHPKTSPPLGKHQPTVSLGATSAHAVATSTPAADTA